MAGMAGAPPGMNRVGRQEERIQAEASQASQGVSEAYPDLQGQVETHKFGGLHHTLRCYSTPRRLSFLIHDP